MKRRGDNLAVAFFYCDYQSTATQNTRNILGSLAKQLAVQDEESFTKLVTQLLASLSDIGEAKNIKSLFLSRDDPDIRLVLKGFVHISIAASSNDLRLFVQAEIELRTRNKDLRIKDQTLKEEIMKRLLDGADGM